MSHHGSHTELTKGGGETRQPGLEKFSLQHYKSFLLKWKMNGEGSNRAKAAQKEITAHAFELAVGPVGDVVPWCELLQLERSDPTRSLLHHKCISHRGLPIGTHLAPLGRARTVQAWWPECALQDNEENKQSGMTRKWYKLARDQRREHSVLVGETTDCHDIGLEWTGKFPPFCQSLRKGS